MALGLRTPDLTLAPRYVDGAQPTDGRQPGGPLLRVRVIPGLFEEKVYAGFVDRLQALGRPWRAFAYDWRRDNAETAARFAAFVAAVRRDFGGGPVDIVAHSMGCLITLAALHDGMPGVERVLLAAGPLRGGVGFLDDMHAGTRSGLNGRVLAPAVLATFPSVYTFFPLHGARLLDEQGHALEVDLYAPDAWKGYRLGIHGRGPVSEAFDAFLAQTLARAKAFRQKLEAPIAAYPAITVLVGKGHPTLSAIRGTRQPAGWTWDVRGGERSDGDGRVCAEHAIPPAGIPYREATTTLGHADVLNDPWVYDYLTKEIP
jgi:pimeloyl-ACP methyl ester carboxylesterase